MNLNVFTKMIMTFVLAMGMMSSNLEAKGRKARPGKRGPSHRKARPHRPSRPHHRPARPRPSRPKHRPARPHRPSRPKHRPARPHRPSTCERSMEKSCTLKTRKTSQTFQSHWSPPCKICESSLLLEKCTKTPLLQKLVNVVSRRKYLC